MTKRKWQINFVSILGNNNQKEGIDNSWVNTPLNKLTFFKYTKPWPDWSQLPSPCERIYWVENWDHESRPSLRCCCRSGVLCATYREPCSDIKSHQVIDTELNEFDMADEDTEKSVEEKVAGFNEDPSEACYCLYQDKELVYYAIQSHSPLKLRTIV